MAEKGDTPDKNEAKNTEEGGAGEQDDLISAGEWFQKYFSKALDISDEPKPESLLDEVTFEGIAKYINSEKCKKIVTMAGAGISTSAGIPDFRSPGTGLYDNLQKYDLPNPLAIFEIDYFMEKPEAFFTLAKELAPGSFKPTPCHYFLRLLEEKKKLHMHFTQNIDTLERVAGLNGDKIVEAHGTFHTSHCLKCRKEYSYNWTKGKIFEDLVPRCELTDCEGIVKPDIVFFGESLPKKFEDNISALRECDLLIILGTSLVVQPFASLTSRVKDNTPRLYINLEKTGDNQNNPWAVLMFGCGFDFDSEDNIRDVFWQGTCDDGCYALADLLGWGEELRKLVKQEHTRLDKEISAEQKKETPAKKSPTKTIKTPGKSATGSETKATSNSKDSLQKSKASGEKSPEQSKDSTDQQGASKY